MMYDKDSKENIKAFCEAIHMMYDKDFEEINRTLREDNRRAFRRAFKQLCDTVPSDFKFTLVRVSTSKISPFTHIGHASYYTVRDGYVYPQSFKNSECHLHGFEIEDFIYRVWNNYIIGNTFYYGHIDAHDIGEKYFKNKYIIN